jgi:GntR family transcriptional repressor for pyruvate dehydrogenase complex
MTINLKSVTRSSLSEKVAEQLIKPIADGTLKPGDQLPTERELIEGLNVGRSSVRAAIQKLAILGLVEVRPGIGTFVTGMGPKALVRNNLINLMMADEITTDLLEAREIIEPQIAALAVQRATEEDLFKLQSLLDEMRSKIDHGEHVYPLSAQFHKVLSEATHNSVLILFMESIMDLLIERGQKTDTAPGYLTKEFEEHQRIVDLIRAAQVDAVRDLVREHIESSSVTYITTVDKT